MQSIPCLKCNSPVNASMQRCPECGAVVMAKTENPIAGLAVIGLLVAGAISLFFVFTGDDPIPLAPEVAAEQARTKEIGVGFSPWDGSHRELVRVVKSNMADPESFDHVDTRFTDHGDYLTVYMTYTGKNAFGGTVSDTVTARTSISGDVLAILE